VTYQNVLGTYDLKNVSKTRLILNADTTFKFIKINQDPYLYTANHVDESFYFTTGHFYLDGKSLFLTSDSNSTIVNTIKLNREATILKYSDFRFHDIYNDSVGAGYVVLPDSSIFIAGFDNKQDIYNYSEDMTKTKSLEFVFYGYGNWKYVADDNSNYIINVQLMPEFRTNIFKQTLFKIKNKSLVQNKNGKNYKFLKTKNGM